MNVEPNAATCVGILRPASRREALLYDAGTVVAGSVVIALLARAAIPLPFSPVPVTGQTLGVLVAGMTLGSRRGLACVLAYLVEGAAGLPVFAGGAGLACLAGPTGGYLLGFLPAAYVIGLLAERGWDRHPVTTVTAMIIGNALLYVGGLVWLARFGGTRNVLALGLYPFIPGDVTKLAIAAALLPTIWRIHRKVGSRQGNSD
jgi:biotin transport system substrate-specific component